MKCRSRQVSRYFTVRQLEESICVELRPAERIMAKNSGSSRRSLKNLFSKSEVSLNASGEPESLKGTPRLFRWRRKKRTDGQEEDGRLVRTESLAGGDGESQDGQEWTKRKRSLFGTVLRSKKGLRSYSETDLRKSKGFIASLSWKKKTNKRDLSQGLSSHSEDPGAKDHIREQEECDKQEETEQNQVGFEAARPTAEPSCSSDQSHSQDARSDVSRPFQEDAGFMPSDQESTSIPYIDSSLSDSEANQTPPDSPSPRELSSETQAEPDTGAEDGSAQDSSKLSFSSGTSPAPNMGTAGSTDTCTVRHSSTDLNPNGGDDPQLYKSGFETSTSGISAEAEVKGDTTDVTPHTDGMDSQDETQRSTSSSPESFISSIPQSTTSSAEADHLQIFTASNRNMSVSHNDMINPDRHDSAATDTCSIMSSMPDVMVSSSVSSSRMAEHSLEAHRELSFSSTDVSEAVITVPSTADSLEETHPEINSETISMESHQTNNYSSSACATDSEKPHPAEPVLLENESNITLPPSAAPRTYTIIKSSQAVTFDLSGCSDSTSPDRPQRGLSNNKPYSDAETLTETSNRVIQESAQAESEKSFFPDHGISSTLTSDITPAIITQSSLLPDASDQLFSSQSPKAEEDEDVQGVSTQSSESTDQDEPPAERVTTRNGLQMFVKNQHEPDVEEASRDDTFNESRDVTFDQDLKSWKAKVKPRIMDDQGETAELHEVSEKLVEERRAQSTREASPMEAEVCGDNEAMTGQAEQQIHPLAPLKPALPVGQECGPEECAPAPPSSQPLKVSLADSSVETHSHLEMWLHPLAPHQSSGEITIPEDTARCKYHTSIDNHAERDEHACSEETEDLGTSLSRTQDRDSQEHSTGTIYTTNTTEETFRHTTNTSYKQGEVTVTKVKTARDIAHRNWVQISESTSEDTQEEQDTAEIGTFPDQLLSSITPGERLFHASAALSTVIEEPDTESQEETESVCDTDMNSSVAVLSTKLSRPSSAREGRDDTMVVRKVSLVNTDTQGDSGNRESASDRLELREEPEPSRASPELERRWKSLYSSSEEKQYSFTDTSDYRLTESTYLRSSQVSPSYEKGVYTSHFHPPETQPTAFSSETDGSLGNSDRRAGESEVHRSSESYSGGRGRVELSVPGAREGEQEIRKTVFDSQPFLDSHLMIVEADDCSSDVFQATRVELIPSPTGLEPETLSSSPYSEMDNLVDTLKSMDRPLRQRLQRTPSNTPFSSLPPIEEDAPVSPLTPLSPQTPVSPFTEHKNLLNGVSGLPVDIGINWSTPKDMRSPLTMMKEFGETQNRTLALPLRASALNSIVMRRGSLNDLSPEESPAKGVVNGGSSSRLENSFFFQPSENGKASNRSIFRAASLPEIGPSQERMSLAAKGSDTLLGSRFERFSFLTSPSNSLSGLTETSRMSVAPSVQDASVFNHKSTVELYRSLPSETLLKNSPHSGLQRSSSLDGGFLMNDTKSFQVNQKQEPERNLAHKYRAFPDAYLTKEKEHGKLNPRPGKMLIYEQPGFVGERIEVRGDVVDATPWEFTGTISVRVIRGGWVFYEKPNFKGEKLALDEDDIELTDPFGPADEEVADQENGPTPDHGEEDQEPKPRMKRKFTIGSIRRAVRDYSVPEISLFPEDNAEGKKVTFRDTSEDARIFGFPIKANSIIINAGLWLVFAEPFFQGVPRVLEVGGFSSPAAWGVTHPYVGSLHPLKIGEPRVENLYEPKIVLYEKPYFTGKSREIFSSMRDFLSRVDKQQSLFMFSAGSLKVMGGCWVGYEKEGFRGHQYLLEEGEYHDWRVWGGVDSELRSVRVIQADLSEPLLVLYGMPEEEKEEQEERTFEVTEAVGDVELFGFGTNTRSIHVLSGAWVAYSHVDFSGNQYVLEKGFYNNCGDWGSGDNRICSIQPILPAPSDGPRFRNEVLLYSEPDFQGSCRVCHQNQACLPESLSVKSCRVVGGSWVMYGAEQFGGDMYVLSEGDYPNRTSMGFPPDASVRSVKAVPMTFSMPSVSLFGLECFEGREVTIDTQVSNMQEEGFNTQFLSVRVNSGCWVLCEHSNYRGRQFLLEPIEITNWLKFSSVSCIGSLYPVRQKQRMFRIRNKETGHYISVQGGVEDMKTGRVVVSEQVEGMSDMWFYQDGLIKNKLARTVSLQVMGNVESGAKVVLWTETRVPVQTWSAQVSGCISSITFPGMVLDIKGGKTYDRQHVVIREENEEQPSQQWELEFV